MPSTSALAFPQQLEPRLSSADWQPRFIDYLYVALTNTTAFSPTDVMPLAPWAKIATGTTASARTAPAVRADAPIGAGAVACRSRSKGLRPAVAHRAGAELHPGPDTGHVHEVTQPPVQRAR